MSGESGGENGSNGGTQHVEKSHNEAGVKILGVRRDDTHIVERHLAERAA